ncbi:Imm50 family immunity protein [Silvibacterium sp.]|uniref:Imm50 family immunity protein n=1 Tax=Silvibacterium sp. TaxID=1964179 RepID=UPI0039E38DA8
MNNTVASIRNSEKLTRIFGQWPSFHDAEVLEIHLNRGNFVPSKKHSEMPFLTMTVWLWEMTKEVNEGGYFILRNHTRCTFQFRDVSKLELSDFNSQNAIWGLEIEKKEREEKPTPYFAVGVQPSFGIAASFECVEIEITNAELLSAEEVAALEES